MDPPKNERLIHTTTSLCSTCKNGLSASVYAAADERVWMTKQCPEHGFQRVQLSDSAAWYEETRAVGAPDAPPQTIKKEVERGCPFDCGPCASHKQKVRLPVVTITSSCNLDCPICYVHNKNNDAFHMKPEDFSRILEHLVEDHGSELDLVNFTGGDPTMHPHFLDFVEMSHAAGIHRVSICTNGVALAQDESLVERLAALGGRVALAFDSFEREADYIMQGAHLVKLKLRCLDLLEKHGVDTTLIPVVTKGLNDHEIGRIIETGLERSNIRHVEVHTMTYTGQGGVSFDRSGRISIHEVLQKIEETTAGLLTVRDFVPSPCAHPLCYQIAYVLIDPAGGRPIPFTRLMSRQTFYECLGDRLYLEPSPRLELAFQEAIDHLWVRDDEEAQRALRILNDLIRRLFPARKPLARADALKVSEAAIKAVYVHSHMDEDTFDTERAAECCDSNCYADGTTIPVCNYNVLYREKEARFMTTPLVWNERSGGQLVFDEATLRGHAHV